MKITSISCTQFAGVRDRSVALDDGINVIYGKNESGKSTLVNLISRTLFQNARLDRRSDKDFFELYFPGVKKGSGTKGDFADGKISIETENGVYTLTKEWGADARCTLSSPDGVIRDQQKIDGLLREVLLYGEGVYSDLLFSSQRNTDVSLQTILDASKKSDAKQEITDAVSQAFAEADGISIDAIEREITAKVEEIAGKHWDFEREVPVRKAGRWSTGLGEILKAYYAWEDAKAVQAEISRLELEADHAAEEYNNADKAVCGAEEAYNRFQAFANRLAVRSERRKAVERIERELAKIEEVLSYWPRLANNLERAKILQSERTSRAVLDQYEAAKAINDEIIRLRNRTTALACPSAEEIASVKADQRNLAALENKLCGMNLTAAITMLNGNQVKITSLRTGKAVELSGDIAAITEAVRIVVPGVLEMQLSPADVNIALIEAQIAEQKKSVESICAKYRVNSPEELESLAKIIADSTARLDHANARLKLILGTTSFEELEATASAITETIRTKEEIEDNIARLCRKLDISSFITRIETVLEGYLTEYGSMNDLKARAFDLETELKQARESITDAEDIPAEYLNIADSEAYLESLQNELKAKRSRRELALTAKTAAASRLESCKENSTGDPTAEAEKAERIFEETKSLLSHWLHIAEVFKAQKESIHANPMQDIADRFVQYLGVISDGKLSSEFSEANKLNMNLYSENSLLDYGKLSEGTKETVSLAFRLAVLDHLFPEGGGVIVLDDPFTDMDAERTAQSCKVVLECAKWHQVIFLTCKDEYTAMLGGAEIRI